MFKLVAGVCVIGAVLASPADASYNEWKGNPVRGKDGAMKVMPFPRVDYAIDTPCAYSMGSSYQELLNIVHPIAMELSLDVRLIMAVIATESNFNATAISPKNAQGLMQLIPATAKRFGVKNVFNPEENIRGGALYLKWLLNEFGGDTSLTLAGYNAGEGAVKKYGGIPPYAETQGYVKKVLNRYRCSS